MLFVNSRVAANGALLLDLLGRDTQDVGAGARENSNQGRQSRGLDNRHFSGLKRATTSHNMQAGKQLN